MSDLINQLRRKANGYACLEQEAADRITELESQLTKWEKLKDPINLHVNLLRGVPCRLDRMQHLLHLAGATDYDYLKAANAKMRKALLGLLKFHQEGDDGAELPREFWSGNYLDAVEAAEEVLK